jgi:hypothetical protein
MLLPPLGPNQAFYASVAQAIQQLQNPGKPSLLFSCATADMPTASDYTNCVLLNTTLDILAVSDGTNWIRQDTGAAI